MEITESPCVQVCVIDPAARLCVGCGRTIDEISRWAAMSAAERRSVMEELPARIAGADLPAPATPVRTGRRRLRQRG
ncbi:DUF1289 domain-containing protein [Alsobacter sp. KACC 23698]|uniref:DUF1289 domain-containing protein n=1 Tax=Alsobacter sp. KACC 23698 TaxID=3149229 RepID=A0AAU7JG70_9HYPH